MSDSSDRPLPLSDYDFALPDELIAQEPLADRASSRLLVVDRSNAELHDKLFRDIPELFRAGDVLVINDSRVIPGRLRARRPGGGSAEFLLLHQEGGGFWIALGRPTRRMRPGMQLQILDRAGHPSEYSAEVSQVLEEGQVRVQIPAYVAENLVRFGDVPLPPYIHSSLDDDERYQTVYSRAEGSAAAPTAGLHFTHDLLQQIRERGVDVRTITLHVGLGTFRPIHVDDARDHKMHAERYHVSSDTVAALSRAKRDGRRVIAVGTTSCRTLESIADDLDSQRDLSGTSDLYITPGFRFRVVDAMVTNFHLPRSSLLLLVSALAGRDQILRAYEHAIEHRYRFFSFGDAMFIA